MECPTCMDPLGHDEQWLPCACGYQLCMFCWKKIKEEGNGKCPICRAPYGDDYAVARAPPPREPAAAAAAAAAKARGPASALAAAASSLAPPGFASFSSSFSGGGGGFGFGGAGAAAEPPRE